MLRLKYMHHIVKLFAQIRIWVLCCSIFKKWAFRACLIFLCELALDFSFAKGTRFLPASSIVLCVRIADAAFLITFHKLMAFLEVRVFKPDAEVFLDGYFLYESGYFIECPLQTHSAFLKFIFGTLAVGYVVKGYDGDGGKVFADVRDIVYGALEIFPCRM